MTVGDVVNLVGQIDGFNRRMLDDYGQRLIDNNINGAVLMSCDLAELKPVLQMAFGDWVLFRSLAESLRFGEQNSEISDGSVSPPMEAFARSTAASDVASEARNASASAAVTTAAAINVASSSKKVTSDTTTTLTSVSNSDVVLAAASRSTPALKDPPTSGDVDAAVGAKPAAVAPPAAAQVHYPPLSRQDSFVSEVLMESETLRGFIQASMLGSDSEGGTPDSDDEVQRPIAPIPEEPTGPVSRNTSAASSLGHVSPRAVAQRMSIDSSGPIDRAFSVGPDHDSGESDSEVERISRRSSIHRPSAAHGGAGPKPETDAAQASTAAEDRHRKSASKSTKHAHHDSHRASPKHANRSKSATKLDKGGSECAVPLMSLYFPIACERGGGHAESQSSGSYVSPKSSRPTVSQSSVPSSRGAAADDSGPAAGAGSSSRHHEKSEKSSSSSGQHPQPTSSSSSAANHVPSSGSATNRVAAPTPQVAESTAETTAPADADNVKFFIVDESDTSPKAIMVEMDAIPPHRVSSSVTSDASYDPNRVIV